MTHPGAAPVPAADAVPSGPTWDRLEEQLAWYDSRSARAQRNYKRLKIVEMVVAAAVPVLAALAVHPAVTASAAAVVVVLEGAQQLYQWQTLWVRYRSTAESLKHERYLYLARAGPYVGADRLRILAERIEGLISQEHATWTQAHAADPSSRDQQPPTGA